MIFPRPSQAGADAAVDNKKGGRPKSTAPFCNGGRCAYASTSVLIPTPFWRHESA